MRTRQPSYVITVESLDSRLRGNDDEQFESEFEKGDILLFQCERTLSHRRWARSEKLKVPF